MIDYDWVTEEDKNLKFSCIKNPKDCKDGLTLSIWEKNTFDEITNITHVVHISHTILETHVLYQVQPNSINCVTTLKPFNPIYPS